MRKFKKIIVSIILIIAITLAFGTNASNADSTMSEIFSDAGDFLNAGAKGDTTINKEALQQGSSLIYNVLLVIGVAVALIWGVVLGIQFITGGLSEKADVKKGLTIYIVGCVIIFGAFGIWKLVINILTPLAK